MQGHDQAGHDGHFHAVQFYQDDPSLTRIVAGFLAEGFTGGHPGVVIATPEHRLMIETALRARGVDVDELKSAGDFVLLDARETLASFMTDGMPVATRSGMQPARRSRRRAAGGRSARFARMGRW